MTELDLPRPFIFTWLGISMPILSLGKKCFLWFNLTSDPICCERQSWGQQQGHTFFYVPGRRELISFELSFHLHKGGCRKNNNRHFLEHNYMLPKFKFTTDTSNLPHWIIACSFSLSVLLRHPHPHILLSKKEKTPFKNCRLALKRGQKKDSGQQINFVS